jgi:hypothetical protein
MPPNATMVLTEIKNAIEMNAIPKDKIKELIKGQDWIKQLMKSGGMLVLISVPALACAVGGFFLLKALAKKYKAKLQPLVDKVSKMLFYSIFIRALLVANVSLCVSAKYGSLFYQEEGDEPLNIPVALLVCALIAASFFIATYVE